MDLSALIAGVGTIPALVTFIVVVAVFGGLFGFNFPFFNFFGG